MCDGTQTSCAIDPITGAAGAAGHAVTDAAGRAAAGIASDAVGAVAGDWLQSEMSSFVTWCAKAVIWATSWWAGGTTIDPNTPTVIGLQRQIVPIALLILTFGVFWQAGKMIVSRKPAPLVDVVSGLVRYVAVSVAGLAFWEAVIQLCDYATAMILNSTKQDFGTALGQDLIGLAAPGSVNGPALPMLALLVIGLVLMIVSCIQWLLAWVRLAGIQILAVLLPLAAAGSITESTRAWLRKVNAWMLALVTYKLIAAIIYRIGFAFLVGPLPGTQPDMAPVSRTMIGLMVLLLAVFCLPVMMKFFAFLGADSAGGGVAGAVLGAGAVAAGSVKLAGMLRGGASSSAAQVAANGPGGAGGAGGAGSSGGPAALPPGPGGPPGPAPQGAAPATSPGSQTGGPGPGAGRGGGNQTGNQPPPSGPGTPPGKSPGQSSPAPGASPAPATSAPGATSTPGVTPATTPAAGAGTAGAGAASAGTAGAGTAAATAGPAGVVLAAGAAAVRQVNSQAHGVGGQPPETS